MDKSIKIGGSNYGGVLNTGDHVSNLSAPTQNSIQQSDVDILQELQGLREILTGLQSDAQAKIGRALDDAEEDAAKPDADKKEVQSAIERALNHAKKAVDFTEVIEKLATRLTPIAVWLGLNSHHFLPLLSP